MLNLFENLVICLLILMINLSCLNSSNCNEYSIPKSFALRGYIGNYRQNLTDYPVNVDSKAMIDDVMRMAFEPSPVAEKTITFATLLAEPFSFAMTTENNEEGLESFVVWGPLYSLVRVAAQRLNYSIEGINMAGRSVLNCAVRYMADFGMAPVFVHFKSIAIGIYEDDKYRKMLKSLGIKPTAITRPVDIEMIDCIIFRKEYYQASLFEFLAFIDGLVKWLFVSSILVTAIVLASFKLRKLWFYLKRVIESLFGLESNFQSRFQGMFVLWITVYWLFQQLFGGHMFSEMASPLRPKLIDSWQDLAKRPKLKILATNDYGEAENESDTNIGMANKEDYFNRQSPLYEDFTSRVRLVSSTDLQSQDTYSMPDGEVVDLNAFDGNVVVMSLCRTLRYRRYNVHCGRDRERIHVSQSGGEMLPYFFTVGSYAEDVEVAAVNKVSVLLTETGLFQRWLQTSTYDLKEDNLKQPIFEYTNGELKSFKSPLRMFATILIITLLVLCFEMMLKKVMIVLAALMMLASLGQKQSSSKVRVNPKHVW